MLMKNVYLNDDQMYYKIYYQEKKFRLLILFYVSACAL